MIKKILKRFLAPIVREMVREETDSVIETARQLVLKDLNRALSEIPKL